MDNKLKEVEANIRACIGSSKGPVYLRNLERDYNTLIGGRIPYRDYNHASLESFLQSLSSLRVCGRGGDAMVEAAADRSSTHMTSLIAKQKNSKKSVSRYVPSAGRGFYPRPPRGRYGGPAPPRNYRPPDQGPRYNAPFRYNAPPRYSAPTRHSEPSTYIETPQPSKYNDTSQHNGLPRYTEPPRYSETKQSEQPRYTETKQSEPPRYTETKKSEQPRYTETKQSEPPRYAETKQSEQPRRSYVPPRFQHKKELPENEENKEPLRIKVEDNERHVLWSTKSKKILVTISNPQDKSDSAKLHQYNRRYD